MLPPRVRSVLGKTSVEQYYGEEAEKVLNPVDEFLTGRGVKAEALSRVGPVADTIIDVAKTGKFDLIMMGTHGHGALGRLVMGSVSTQVLAGCDVPVLLIR